MKADPQRLSRPVADLEPRALSARAWFAPLLLAIALTGLLASPLIPHAVCRAEEPATTAGADGDELLTVIKAGKVIPVVGDEIDNGIIVLAGSKIRSVGRGLEYPLNARVIEAHDRVVMPGLINPHTRFGLPGYARTGVHGDCGVTDEYRPRAGAYDELLDSGYTTLALIPAGDGIPGRAMVVRIAGPEDQRALVPHGYLRVTPDKTVLREALDRAQKEIEKVEKARQEFEKKQEEARKQEEAKKAQEQKAPEENKAGQKQPDQPAATQPAAPPTFQPPPIDPALQVLVDLIQKKPDLAALVEINQASSFAHMHEVLDQYPIAHHFLARNGWQADLDYVVEPLGERKAKLILLPLLNRMPFSAERNNLVKRFADAGCEVSLRPLSDSPQEHQRMLSRVAELVRAGWSRAEALKAVTLHPARLLGLDSRLGSIEKGKDADLIFLDGDPFDPTTRVRDAMIAGEMIRCAEGSK